MKIRTYLVILLADIFLLTSCSGFLDINDDPNTPKKGELNKLLSNAELATGDAFSDLSTILPSYVFHLSSREVDNYSITANYAYLGNSWNSAYTSSLKNIDEVIQVGTEKDNLIYVGIAKLLKAYIYLNLVDLWGDAVYTEYNKKEILAPKLDKGEFVYNTLLSLIDEAVENINDSISANLIVPKTDDIFYGGNTKKWIKLSNTLKLKILVQSRKAKTEITDWNTKLTSLLSENNFLENGEDFELRHSKQDNPDERHPSYVDEYLGGQSTYYISPWIYEMMSGLNYNVTDNPFIGIVDPRIPYYWVKQIKANGEAQNKTDYRDGGFVSIFFASNGPNAASAQRKTSTFIGIYPCGGAFDDDSGVNCDKTAGNGVAPTKLLQAYSVPFLLAELYLTGESSGDAKAKLEEGIIKSFTHVNSVVKASDETVPLIKEESITNFINQVMGKYDNASSNEEKLRIVMTQKWIANFFNPIEAYTDYRRTGLPTLLSKNTSTATSPYKSSTTPELGPVNIPLKGLNSYPRAMWYPSREINNNKNISNIDRNLSTPIVFWDK